MKHLALIAAAAMFASMTGSAFAECDTHKGDRDTDKQTACSEKCEDGYTSGKQHYGADIGKLKQESAACFEKCGCAEHGAKYIKD
ncbi:hypothetical protein [Methylocystis heyeri]|uniref:Low-complexity protein n=1 Tax=Methylocystis heyeri TaxID=391905 RepID=A0A6B8KGL5_9HYPH|nr:hypothetical protein [Methylocystis heyeri]QGM47514.1 hypothetical protein H2LOC_018495 [Methylocystis heyeri]